MYCRKCGEENLDDAVFCKNCGEKLIEEVKKSEIIEEIPKNNQRIHSSTYTPPNNNSNDSSMGCCGCIIAIFIIFGLLALIFWL